MTKCQCCNAKQWRVDFAPWLWWDLLCAMLSYRNLPDLSPHTCNTATRSSSCSSGTGEIQGKRIARADNVWGGDSHHWGQRCIWSDYSTRKMCSEVPVGTGGVLAVGFRCTTGLNEAPFYSEGARYHRLGGRQCTARISMNQGVTSPLTRCSVSSGEGEQVVTSESL